MIDIELFYNELSYKIEMKYLRNELSFKNEMKYLINKLSQKMTYNMTTSNTNSVNKDIVIQMKL